MRVRQLFLLPGILGISLTAVAAGGNKIASAALPVSRFTVKDPAGVLAPIIPVHQKPARIQPGQLARNDTALRRLAASGPAMIAPKPAPALSWPYLMPREMATIEARRIWSEKLREADEKKFQWKKAFSQSFMLLGIEEAYRLGDQPSTRAQLKGPFFRDWFDSVSGLHGWGDTDSWLANYVGHPFQGAITGYIEIQNDPRGRLQEFGKSKAYWKSRLKAAAWAFAYSTEYELGPIGDASIGNVGHPVYNPGTKGYCDLVVTPTMGLALLVLEDILDQKVVWPIEKRTNNKMAKRLLRSFLGMHRAFTNLFRFKLPWYIDARGPVNQPAIRYSQLPM